MKAKTPCIALAIASMGVALSAHSQFFNASAMGVVMVVGQKRSCSARFPELAGPLQAAFDTFVVRNSDVVSPAPLKDLDKPSELEKSPVFAGLKQEDCAALVQSIPLVSLRELIQEQERLNKEREQAEKR